MSTEQQPLIIHPIREACKIKWTIGQSHYGPEFVGDPIEQLFEEAVDGINYCKEGRDNWDYDRQAIMEIEGDLYMLAGKIRDLYAKGKKQKRASAKQFAKPA